jgi:hypothetical protein
MTRKSNRSVGGYGASTLIDANGRPDIRPIYSKRDRLMLDDPEWRWRRKEKSNFAAHAWHAKITLPKLKCLEDKGD